MMRPSTRIATCVLLSCLAAACSKAAPPGPRVEARKYLLDRVDDAAVVQVYADGFSALPLKEKTLLWHLYQAAIAGRDIYYDQISAHGLEMRAVIEGIVGHPEMVNAQTLGEVQRYAKLFWINSGPYNNLTAKKFVLTCSPQAFADAARLAAAEGARFPTAPGESLDQLLARLQPMFFDPSVAPSITTKTPPPGQDILTASANNLYSGVTMSDLKGFSEHYALNSRLVKRPGGGLVEEVYRVGGRYDAPLGDVVTHLEEARSFATAPMAKALDALIKWYRTGEPVDRRAYDVAWVEDKASPDDTINGFTEVYLDPRSEKGAWEAAVFHVNQEKTEAIHTLAANAQWFEDHMPWDAKYRKSGVKGITANAVDIIVETGNAGPVTPIGINLPNDEQVRQEFGSKSVSLWNVNDAYTKSTDPRLRSEFAWTPDEAARSEKWGGLSGDLTTDMHEVIGHASGKLSDRVQGKPQTFLKEYFSALEEGRADLVGLYFLADPKLAELGVVPAADQPDIARAEYEAYTRNALVQLRRVKQGESLEEDHMRNRQMIVRWLMANTKAIETRQRDGKTFYVVVDPAAFREGAGRLLAEVQRIKSEGDFGAAKALFDTYGIHFDPALRDEVVRRVDALGLPSYTGFVMPRLEAVTGPDGTVTDVKISYPQDLQTQMLEYSDMTRASRDAFMSGSH